jgi:hypothetical protein
LLLTPPTTVQKWVVVRIEDYGWKESYGNGSAAYSLIGGAWIFGGGLDRDIGDALKFLSYYPNSLQSFSLVIGAPPYCQLRILTVSPSSLFIIYRISPIIQQVIIRNPLAERAGTFAIVLYSKPMIS